MNKEMILKRITNETLLFGDKNDTIYGVYFKIDIQGTVKKSNEKFITLSKTSGITIDDYDVTNINFSTPAKIYNLGFFDEMDQISYSSEHIALEADVKKKVLYDCIVIKMKEGSFIVDPNRSINILNVNDNNHKLSTRTQLNPIGKERHVNRKDCNEMWCYILFNTLATLPITIIKDHNFLAEIIDDTIDYESNSEDVIYNSIYVNHNVETKIIEETVNRYENVVSMLPSTRISNSDNTIKCIESSNYDDPNDISATSEVLDYQQTITENNNIIITDTVYSITGTNYDVFRTHREFDSLNCKNKFESKYDAIEKILTGNYDKCNANDDEFILKIHKLRAEYMDLFDADYNNHKSYAEEDEKCFVFDFDDHHKSCAYRYTNMNKDITKIENIMIIGNDEYMVYEAYYMAELYPMLPIRMPNYNTIIIDMETGKVLLDTKYFVKNATNQSYNQEVCEYSDKFNESMSYYRNIGPLGAPSHVIYCDNSISIDYIENADGSVNFINNFTSSVYTKEEFYIKDGYGVPHKYSYNDK